MDTEFAKFTMQNGILETSYKSERVTLEIAKEVVRVRKEFTEGKPMPGIGMISQLAILDKEARDYLSSPDGIEGVTAAAVLCDSQFRTLLMNFFLKVTNHGLPARVFTNREEAVQWLQQFK